MHYAEIETPRGRWHRQYRAARLAHHQDIYAQMPFAALMFSLGIWALLVYAGWLILWALI
jgi:hypothetical protein